MKFQAKHLLSGRFSKIALGITRNSALTEGDSSTEANSNLALTYVGNGWLCTRCPTCFSNYSWTLYTRIIGSIPLCRANDKQLLYWLTVVLLCKTYHSLHQDMSTATNIDPTLY